MMTMNESFLEISTTIRKSLMFITMCSIQIHDVARSLRNNRSIVVVVVVVVFVVVERVVVIEHNYIITFNYIPQIPDWLTNTHTHTNSYKL